MDLIGPGEPTPPPDENADDLLIGGCLLVVIVLAVAFLAPLVIVLWRWALQ